MKPHRSFVLATLAFLVLSFFASVHSPVARAASMVVTTTADDTNDEGACSLREAVTNANNDALTFDDCAAGSGFDAITFAIPVGDAGCSVLEVCTITLVSFLPAITDADGLLVDGSAQKITLSGNLVARGFVLVAGASLQVNALTITKGAAGQGFLGGGILNNGGTLNVTNSTFTGNVAVTGGAIAQDTGTTNITNSTISDNLSGSQLANGTSQSGGTLNVYNSTISGAGLTNAQLTTVGIETDSGTTIIQNTIVADHNGGDCKVLPLGTLTANGFNLDTDASCDSATTSATINLGPLQDNGGPTPTMALGENSSALGAAFPSVCANAPVNGLDQRGITRPQGLACDVGAFESNIFFVNVTEDSDDGSCDASPGDCTLREAINAANSVAGPHIIHFVIPFPPDSGCSMAGVCTITLGSVLADITEDLTIDGEGQSITVSGDNQFPVLLVQNGIKFSLVGGMRIVDGDAGAGDGGGLFIDDDAIVLLRDCTFASNDADEGGAIHVAPDAQLVMTDCTVDDNHALGEDGGGLRNDGGIVTIIRSTFSNNTTVDDGGGLDNRGEGQMFIYNSTLSGNQATNEGGGFRSASGAFAFFGNVTITDNQAGLGGGGVTANQDSEIRYQNSIIAGNKVNGDENDPLADCAWDKDATLASDDYNVVGLQTNCFPNVNDQTMPPSDVFVTLLGPLTNNGGPTETHALLNTSPALNAGRPQGDGGCTDQEDKPLTTDQRGEPRPAGPACDIGAFELQSATAVNVTGPSGKVGKAGNVVVKWKTTSEALIAGFDVYRKTNGRWKKHNTQFIQAKHSGDPQSANYRFKDKRVKAGKLYRYKLKVRYTDNHTEWTNVIKVTTP